MRTPSSAVAAMYSGLALTIVATAAPFIDRVTSDSLTAHIRAGYPGYADRRIDTAVRSYLIYLTAVGLLGIAAWLVTIRAVRTGWRWARWTATVVFALATTIALTDALIRDTSGDTGLPPIIGWVGVLPCLPGLLAVWLLWRR